MHMKVNEMKNKMTFKIKNNRKNEDTIIMTTKMVYTQHQGKAKGMKNKEKDTTTCNAITKIWKNETTYGRKTNWWKCKVKEMKTEGKAMIMKSNGKGMTNDCNAKCWTHKGKERTMILHDGEATRRNIQGKETKIARTLNDLTKT